MKKIPSSNAPSGHLSEENQSSYSERYLQCCVPWSITNNSQDMEETQVWADGWVDREAAVNTHSGIPLSQWKEWTLQQGLHAKWNGFNRERQIPHDLFYLWNPNIYIFMYILKKNNSWTQSIGWGPPEAADSKWEKWMDCFGFGWNKLKFLYTNKNSDTPLSPVRLAKMKSLDTQWCLGLGKLALSMLLV